jgi:hypothetical protein
MKYLAPLFYAIFCISSVNAQPKTSSNRPIEMVIGESIAKIKIGMRHRSVTKLVRDLQPEGIRRGPDRNGYVSGPLLVIVDESSRVVTLSVDLPKSMGLRIGKTTIPSHASLDEIEKLLPGCKLSNGSGGRVLECTGTNGKMHFYDSFSNPKAVWAILP